MRPWLSILAAALATACGAAPEQPSGPLAGRDVVLVVVDTLRADHLGLAGYPKDTAPFLGRLAEDGLVFDRAYSGASWTAPATASLFTGLYPDHHGVVTGLHLHERSTDDHEELRLNRIPSTLRTLPEMMREAGMAFLDRVGATVGPLYATAFMRAGAAVEAGDDVRSDGLVHRIH